MGQVVRVGARWGSSAPTRQGRQPQGGPGALWVLSECPAKRRTDASALQGWGGGLLPISRGAAALTTALSSSAPSPCQKC